MAGRIPAETCELAHRRAARTWRRRAARPGATDRARHAALRAIDWSVVLLVGGLLSVAQAFDEHGLGDASAR
jgi:di/tricarboxylate transporter